MKRKLEEHEYRGIIGIILAGCLGFFLFGFAIFALVEAVLYDEKGALSENATQILSTVAGGIIGILAGYIGGVEAAAHRLTRKDGDVTPDANLEQTVEDEGI